MARPGRHVDVPRRGSDVRSRCDVKRHRSHRRLCPRQRRRPLAEDYHRWRHDLVQLDLSRRGDSCRHRTSGLLMGRRPSRRLWYKAPPAPCITNHIPARGPAGKTSAGPCPRHQQQPQRRVAAESTSLSAAATAPSGRRLPQMEARPGPTGSLGGQIPAGTGPAACSWGAGRLDVFVQGTTGALYHKSYTGSWSGWQTLGGALTSSPAAAAASGSSRIDVFVRGSDGALWQKTYNGGWSGWTSIGGMSQIQTQTIYYVPQAGSTWANQGTAGASYNAYVSTPSLFQTQSNGYPYWGDIGKNDFIYIPAGSATNNQNVASWEIGFHLTGISSGQRFQKIWDKACGGFMIEIDTALGANQCLLTIYRATTGGNGARWYIPTDTVLRTGHNYYIQIAWNTSAGPGH